MNAGTRKSLNPEPPTAKTSQVVRYVYSEKDQGPVKYVYTIPMQKGYLDVDVRDYSPSQTPVPSEQIPQTVSPNELPTNRINHSEKTSVSNTFRINTANPSNRTLPPKPIKKSNQVGQINETTNVSTEKVNESVDNNQARNPSETSILRGIILPTTNDKTKTSSFPTLISAENQTKSNNDTKQKTSVITFNKISNGNLRTSKELPSNNSENDPFSKTNGASANLEKTEPIFNALNQSKGKKFSDFKFNNDNKENNTLNRADTTLRKYPLCPH